MTEYGQETFVDVRVKGKGLAFLAGHGCSATCRIPLLLGSTATAIARTDPGYRFAGWSGACTGTRACHIRVRQGLRLSAVFVYRH